MRHELERDWQQFYPTYQLGDKEIALAEYNAASERAKSDDNALSIANGVLLAALVPSLPVVSPFLDAFLTEPPLATDRITNFAVLMMAMIAATGIVSAYFCHLRRSYVFSARKVIVLRRMLGQSYGPTTLILPNWRIEGADHPFAIRLFPGWTLQGSYPYYAIAALAASFATYGFSLASTDLIIRLNQPIIIAGIRTAQAAQIGFWILWFICTLYYIRRNLFDHHETSLLVATRLISKWMGLRLQDGMQATLYSARLARYEVIRNKIDLSHAKIFAVFREDRRFYHHRGNDGLAIIRALRDRLRGKMAGGGTTITQQLARTLFIKDLHKTVRRKIVEILLARWLEALLTKQEIIEIYLSSVRYDRSIFGIARARQHFFGNDEVNKINSVVLVERISSVTGKFRRISTDIMLQEMIENRLLKASEALGVLSIYKEMVSSDKITLGTDGSPDDLIREFETAYRQYD
jgi:penicillin-binding protein 1A